MAPSNSLPTAQTLSHVEAGEDGRSSPVATKPELSVDPAASAQPLVHITYYTDPLCSWSWAFEPQWRRLRYELGTQIAWTYCMSGMIADWQQYSDPLNDVSRPVQMGPQWYQVRTLSGMPLNEHIWFTDPPASSYPACLAVKAAERQGSDAGEVYLRRLREAVMIHGRNIARWEVLRSVAEEVPLLDAERFHADLNDDSTNHAFREDLKDVRWREIGRFPSLILRGVNDRAILIVGYRPYSVLLDAVHALAPDAHPQRPIDDPVAYVKHWGRLTTREVAEITDGDVQTAERKLADAQAGGEVERIDIPNARQALWRATSQEGETHAEQTS